MRMRTVSVKLTATEFGMLEEYMLRRHCKSYSHVLRKGLHLLCQELKPKKETVEKLYYEARAHPARDVSETHRRMREKRLSDEATEE